MSNTVNIIKNELLGESYTHIKHSSGLSIYVYPKAGYATSYAVFGTKYGSVDTCYKRSDREEYNRIPEGTAHFLEHKLFESEELDAFEQFSKTGASANAYTSFDRTCYLFSCSGNFTQNLEILLGFVRSPYFTEQTVAKEQGIIGQEIDMYRDSPGWQVFFNLLRALYKNHPVNIDIAGTKESIATITADTLHSCYKNYYNLNNMALAVAGNVTAAEVEEIADRLLTADENVTTQRVFDEEPVEPVKRCIEESMPVAMPVFAFGYKETHATPERTVEEEYIMNILLEILVGSTSELYRELTEDGLINREFSVEYLTGPGYASPIFSGESRDPHLAAERISAAASQLKKNGITAEEFETARRKLYGAQITEFNDIDGIANELVLAHFSGRDLFSGFNTLQALTTEQVNETLSKSFIEETSALSVVLPQN